MNCGTRNNEGCFHGPEMMEIRHFLKEAVAADPSTLSPLIFEALAGTI
jgi:hypothetical protein